MERTSVLGAGVMGHGIALLHAVAGFDVRLYDVAPGPLERALGEIDRSLERMRQAGWLTDEEARQARTRLHPVTDLHEAVAGSTWITEAIPEVLSLKHELYQQLEEQVDATTVIASNTSTLPLAELTAHARHPERFIITHYFNPAQWVPLVEVVRGEATDPGVTERTVDLLRRMGKTPVLLKKDTPGFIANRLQAALVREAFSLLEEGVADARDIDLALTAGPGFRWAFIGALCTADFGGLDTWQRVCANLFPVLSNATEPPAWLKKKVAEGALGAKTGRGIFDYAPGELEARLDERDDAFVQLMNLRRRLPDRR
ncbi:3-hydroxyacyl-CoA dehydrogenase family protein [Alicyclobacillus sp.]|uniref:3-hydroxyacyl-CoA dehydrogenase family protein n=1 Tax=Alicyclobacillus sp. TaxID=61169 RepID=UPI0025B899E0|nr:3-hydroxyacyl-CoA dehydrogenase family protein [Alicyclobacillus sp.]MCL6517284.1 3-hydroxyacyl-CoA dehydrogenase family protein [Alicyclobacillus sp.]